jgi:hypothetical protein
MVKRRRRVGHIIRMGEKSKQNVGSNTCRKDHRDDIGVYEGIILKIMLRNYDGVLWTGFIWLRLRTS